MAEYYGVERTPEYLMHYGIKGMRWGVRKAREHNDAKRLEKHFNRAQKKYNKLIAKTDITKRANNAYADRALLRGGSAITGIQAGLSGALLLKEGKKALPFAAFATGPTAAATGIAGVGYLRNKKAMTTKGHDKAVRKVKQWESEMNKAFKGTRYATNQKFDDKYHIDELRYGKNGYYEKTLASIPGSHLTTDYNGKDKQRFLKIAGSVPKKPSSDFMSGRRAMSSNKKTNYSINHPAEDPMSFNYNYRSLTRKRKDKKLPWYMSSTDTYREYKRK